MSSPKFQDLSAGSKSLVIIDFIIFAAALTFAISTNNSLYYVKMPLIENSTLVIFSLAFALVVQLSSLSLGLYNSKLRESFRGIIRRLLLAIAIGLSIISLLNSLYSEQPLPLEVLVVSSVFSFVFSGIFRYVTFKFDFFGLNKRKVLVLGSGERAVIIEQRLRRDVDRQNFHVHGFVVMNGDSEQGIVNENLISLDTSLVSYAIEHDIDEIVVANDERRNNLPVDELFACKIRGVEITEILDFIERETGQIAVNLIYP
ncbi:MAG: sugar transferase, partial [Colwellia sp.]|nr:sugar transferase [Colwellia sp.]